MKTTLLLITLLWTLFSFANELPEDIQMTIAKERIETLISQSVQLRESAAPTRDIAASSSYLKEFDVLMKDDSDRDYLELASQY